MIEEPKMINDILDNGRSLKQFFIQCFCFGGGGGGSLGRFLKFGLLWSSIRNNTVIINMD